MNLLKRQIGAAKKHPNIVLFGCVSVNLMSAILILYLIQLSHAPIWRDHVLQCYESIRPRCLCLLIWLKRVIVFQ